MEPTLVCMGPTLATSCLHTGHPACLPASRNLYETELSLLADPDYMHNHGPEYQPKLYIDQSMRMIVISWLVEVACEYELHQETLFLAAALLDRFMSTAKVQALLDARSKPLLPALSVHASLLQRLSFCMLKTCVCIGIIYPAIKLTQSCCPDCHQIHLSPTLPCMKAHALESVCFTSCPLCLCERLNLMHAHTFPHCLCWADC